jgi:hypothetical protein
VGNYRYFMGKRVGEDDEIRDRYLTLAMPSFGSTEIIGAYIFIGTAVLTEALRF